MATKLHELITNIPGVRMLREGDPVITGISTDSRKVTPGDLFVAIRGGQIADRHDFIPQAITAGAVGLIVEDQINIDASISIVQVPSTRKALSLLAKKFYKSPANYLHMIGITGTNGKTTTTTLTHAILNAGGWSAGLIGSLEYRVGERSEKAFMTTPEADVIQRLLREMADSGCKAAAMEVSSHGLALGRVDNIPFEIAVFTNLTEDHLDFHGTFDEYLYAKSLLFNDLSENSIAVVNNDDPSTDKILRDCKAQVIRFGESDNADIFLLDGYSDWNGSNILVQTPEGKIRFTLALRGKFHQKNVMAAVGVGIALGIAPEVMEEAIRDVRVSGRFEAIECGQNFGVIIDSGHTPDALEKLLNSAREFTKGQLICVFGCDGDRDRFKRPLMGEIADKQADFIVLTSGHPHFEKPESVINDILSNMGTSPYLVEPDRKKAIAFAINKARDGDVVVIAGKSQDYQIVAHKLIPLDDRDVARSVLGNLGFK